MRIASVSVQVGRKFTRNYNSVNDMVGFTADLREDDNYEEVIRQLQAECLRLLLKEKSSQEKPANESPTD